MIYHVETSVIYQRLNLRCSKEINHPLFNKEVSTWERGVGRCGF